MIREWIEPDDVWDKPVIVTLYCAECGFHGKADGISRFGRLLEATCDACGTVQEIDE